MKNESVATYGLGDVVSGFCAKTLKLAQQSSTASILNTDDVASMPFNVYGIVHGVFDGHVYRVIGLVLNALVGINPRNGLSQVVIVDSIHCPCF